MSMSTAQTISRLNTLVTLNQASEIGFTHAAEHVRNRGLKIYLKHYAAQRAQFAVELQELIHQLGGKVTTRSNPLAVIHRGWIDIVATLTIGRMNQARVVLQEVLTGEHLALHRYKDAGQEAHPPAVQTLLAEHTAQLRATHEHLTGLIAHNPNVLLVQLYEHADSVQTAVNELMNAGVAAGAIQVTPVEQLRRHQHGYQRQLMGESTTTAALVGAIVGILLCLMVSTPLTVGGMSAGEFGGFLVPLLISALVGIGGGVIFGWLIGQSASEDDAHFYETGLRDGSAVITVKAAQASAKEAHRILEMQRNKERQDEFALAGAPA
jgi:uncharacterized protein (TIGR02284 family)